MFPPHTIKDGYSPYPSFCCWCINRNFFFSSDLFPAPPEQWHRASRPLLSAGVRYNRMLHGIFCAPVLRWGLEGPPSIQWKHSAQGGWKSCYFTELWKESGNNSLFWQQNSEFCAFSFIFHCYYSSRPLKLNWKEIEAKIATRQFCIGSGGAGNLTDLFHQYFLQFSWRKIAGIYSMKHHSASLYLLLGCPEVGVVEEISLKVSQAEHYQTKEENPTARYLCNSRSHPCFICVCPYNATKLNSADTSVLEELGGTF